MIRLKHDEFIYLRTYIYERYGIFLRDEKKTLVDGRVQRILDTLNMKSFEEFNHYLLKDQTGAAADLLIDKVTTNYTYFMRESSHFEFLMKEALPYWKMRIKDGDLRVWCAACSSGQEAYTIAMFMEEFFSLDKKRWDKKLLATDISKEILAKARQGCYKEEEMSKLPEYWKKRYFSQKVSGLYEVKPIIKEEILFRQFNLMTKPFPFKKPFHIIFCRNVMIYFDDVAKRQLIEKIYESLEVGGYLIIGKSESLGIQLGGLHYICPSIYQKRY